MKVLHVIPAIASCYGGASQAALGMCRALREGGIEVLIATTDADGSARLPVKLGEPITYRGVPVIFFPRQWSESFKYSRPLERWLEGNVKDFDLVEIHAIFSHSSLAAGSACRLHGVPYVVVPIGSLDPWGMARKRFLKKCLWHFGVKDLLKNAARIHYTTAEEKRLAEKTTGLNHGVVIPLGVDEEILNAPNKTVIASEAKQSRNGIASVAVLPRNDDKGILENPYVITLCRLHPTKGLELLLEVFLDLVQKEEFQNWRLVVAGDGERSYVSHLKRLVQEKEGEGQVLFTGWLEGPQKIAALQGASLFVLASHQENFGLSIVEAMACRLPVLVSRNVNLAEEIEVARAGWAVDLARPALLQGLINALQDENERISRGSCGENLVRSRFRWSPAAQELGELYRGVIAASH